MAADEERRTLPQAGDSIDNATFEQILEMDDDDDEFSRSIVYGFFDQAESTFKSMDESIKKKDLAQLSSLGHFLKGSSATLGLVNIKNACEKIQHWGAKKDETGAHDEKADDCLKHIKDEIPKLREEYSKIQGALKRFYEDDS